MVIETLAAGEGQIVCRAISRGLAVFFYRRGGGVSETIFLKSQYNAQKNNFGAVAKALIFVV